MKRPFSASAAYGRHVTRPEWVECVEIVLLRRMETGRSLGFIRNRWKSSRGISKPTPEMPFSMRH